MSPFFWPAKIAEQHRRVGLISVAPSGIAKWRRVPYPAYLINVR
ncbi:hypothetical protein [Kluyvera intermedia]